MRPTVPNLHREYPWTDVVCRAIGALILAVILAGLGGVIVNDVWDSERCYSNRDGYGARLTDRPGCGRAGD